MSRSPLPQHQRVLLLIASGVLMSTMDSSMVNVALPTIMRAYDCPLATTEWIVLIYLLTITVMLLFWGNMSRHVGQGVLYGRGLLIFSAGSLLCSMAPTILLLIFFRFVQAMGASMMMAMGPALIKSVFPPGRLGHGLGQIGIATSMGLMIGPAVSGILIRWSHWRTIFWITVPLGLAVYLCGRDLFSARAILPGERKKIFAWTVPDSDRLGGLLWIVAVSLTILIATRLTSSCCSGDGSLTRHLLPLLLLPPAWGLFLWREAHASSPIFPLALFHRRFFSMAMLSGMLSFTVLFFILILMPFFLTNVLQLPADRVGYVMMAVPLCVFFVAPLAGRLYDRIGARIVATTGLACCLISMLLLCRLQADTSPLAIALRLALLGFGQAMFLAPNSAAALTGVSPDQTGITSSLLATARNMGMLLGTALAGLIFAFSFSRLTGGLDVKDFTPVDTPAFLLALRQTFLVGTFLALAGLVASWMRGKRK